MGHTLVRLGGATMHAQLRRRTKMDLRGKLDACKSDHDGDGKPDPGPPFLNDKRRCVALRAQGCTYPARKYEPLMVRFRDAAGNNVSLRPLCAMCGCA